MRYMVLVMIILLSCGGLGVGQADFEAGGLASLRGHRGVGAVITAINLEASRVGPTTDAIRTAVEVSDDLIDLRCSCRSGTGSSFQSEVDRVTINLAAETIRFWVSRMDDGWVYANRKVDDTFPYKEVTSLWRDSRDVIDGTGHTPYVSAAFRYSQEDGRLQWIWIAGAGGIFQMEFNCWRIK